MDKDKTFIRKLQTYMNEAKMMTNLDAFLSYGLILEDYLFDRDNSIYIPRVLETKLRLSESYLNEMLTNEVKELEDINLVKILYKYIMDKFQLEGSFKECVNKIKDIYKETPYIIDFINDSIIVNIIK